MQYVITGGQGTAQIILVIDGESHVIPSTHNAFGSIIEAIRTGNEGSIPNLLVGGEDLIKTVIGEGVEVIDDVIHYRGEPLYGTLADDIFAYHNSGQPVEGIIAFLNNLMDNPSRNSREQLYEFLNRHNFEITPTGNFRAYKGVMEDFRSIHAGPGYVNGEFFENDHLDNSPGNNLFMPREDVLDNPVQGCGPGLHVGTYNYARQFSHSGKVVLVEVNPSDVVSVPHDSDWQKIRTSYYTVVEEVTEEPEYGYGEYSPYWADFVYDEEDDWGESSWDEEEEYYSTDDVEIEDFLDYLADIVEPYSYKGRVAESYVELVERFFDKIDDDSDEVYSYAQELDRKHNSQSVYAYHIRRLLGSNG